MNLTSVLLLAQLGVTRQPTLIFPDPALDDTAAYAGYQTRLYRDAASNTLQIYLDRRQGRVVHLLADSENESIGFSTRDGRGKPLPVTWARSDADVAVAGRSRIFEYALRAGASELHAGLFLLGSMRVERDFQAWGASRAPLTAAPFELPEATRLIQALGRLAPATQQLHLGYLGAGSLRELQARLQPVISIRIAGAMRIARVVQPSLDDKDTLTLEFRANAGSVSMTRRGSEIVLRARGGAALTFAVRITTTNPALTPLNRDEIFSPAFLTFARAMTGVREPTTAAGRRLERQIRGVELLASREKLMAGLPTYATYFGRDMMVTALMMRPIWRGEMSEFVIASVLRKLSPSGQVSHEEALGGQAVREASAEYASLVEQSLAADGRGARAIGDSLRARAGDVLRDHRRVRENYHMKDGEFQLPVLVSRWLSDTTVTPQRKRAFLQDPTDSGEPRLTRVLRELAFVARAAAAYAASPDAANLVSFAPRDSGRWASASWRDSNAGYGGGRYPMDINAIWLPHALESLQHILRVTGELGFSSDSLARAHPELFGESPLGIWTRDSSALRHAIATWQGASQHFLVRMDSPEVRSRITARLATMTSADRAYWSGVVAQTSLDSLTFLAVALDATGQPLGIANSDPATRLFLGDSEQDAVPTERARADVLRDVRLFVLPYPVGLLVDGIGPVVANDAYASPAIWQSFERDQYHGPRVVWGREVNLFLLGVTKRIADARTMASAGIDSPDATLARYREELRRVSERVGAAVEQSGFHSELWSVAIAGGRPVPQRYGVGADVQLWSTTDLAVRFALSRLP